MGFVTCHSDVACHMQTSKKKKITSTNAGVSKFMNSESNNNFRLQTRKSETSKRRL